MRPRGLTMSARSCHFYGSERQRCVNESDVYLRVEALLEDHSDCTAAPVAQPGRCRATAESVALVRAALSGAHMQAKVAGSKPARGSKLQTDVWCVWKFDLFGERTIREQASVLGVTCSFRYPLIKLTPCRRASGLGPRSFQCACPVPPV